MRDPDSLYFNASMAYVQWVPLAYRLTIVGLVLSMARLGDKLGRRRICVLLGVGSAACGLSPHALADYHVSRRGSGRRRIGVGQWTGDRLGALRQRRERAGARQMSMSFHLGYITGPSVGGFLVDTIGWRWIFFMAMPVAVAAATIAWKVLPESVTERRDYLLDSVGMITLLLTVVSLIVGLQQVARSGFGAVPLAVAVGSVLFLRWLNYHGLSDSVVPPYTEWGKAPEVFVAAFRSSWAVIAGLAMIAIVTSA